MTFLPTSREQKGSRLLTSCPQPCPLSAINKWCQHDGSRLSIWWAPYRPQRYQVLIPGTCKCHLIRKKGLWRYDSVKDHNMGRLCRIFWVGPKCKHIRGRWRDIWHRQKRRKQCDHGGRDWSDAATSQGILAATISWKRQGTDSPLKPSERAKPCQHFDFS